MPAVHRLGRASMLDDVSARPRDVAGWDAFQADDFSVRLRDEFALDAVGAEFVNGAQRTVQAAHASAWLCEPGR